METKNIDKTVKQPVKLTYKFGDKIPTAIKVKYGVNSNSSEKSNYEYPNDELRKYPKM